jgi:hypothetical protein
LCPRSLFKGPRAVLQLRLPVATLHPEDSENKPGSLCASNVRYWGVLVTPLPPGLPQGPVSTEMLTLARDAGFKEVQHISAAALAQRYFAGRTDGLRPPNNSEELLVAT